MAKPILVGYDPRRADHAPVHLGVAAARFTGAPLVVASVEAALNPLSRTDADLVGDCTRAVEDVETELKATGIGYDCLKLQSTSAARALHEEAERQDAGLLVVGSSARQGPGRVLAGTTAQRLLHGSPCPVAVAPRSWTLDESRFDTIGVAYVDSPDGREALHGAHALARRMGARLRVVTVVKVHAEMYLETEPSYPDRPDGRDVVDVEGEHRIEAERHLREVVAELGDGVPVEVDALVGEPDEALVDLSQRLDLLVCGSRGYGPARAVLLGSVSRHVVAAAHCPVIVLPRGVEAALEALMAETPGATAAV